MNKEEWDAKCRKFEEGSWHSRKSTGIKSEIVPLLVLVIGLFAIFVFL